MNFDDQPFVLTAYLISNLVSVGLVWFSWKKQGIARLLYALLFIGAAWVNGSSAIKTPEIYLDYTEYAIPMYSHFINGFFSLHITPIILTIALCQLAIGISMLLKKTLFGAGAVGGIIFLICISPLGIGAAFPATLLMAAGLYLLYVKKPAFYLWQAVAFKK